MFGSFALFALAEVAAFPALLAGQGRPIDGDSLMVGQQEVRLFGIDAPELGQTCTKEGNAWPCGRASADQLTNLIDGRPVSCSAVGTDKYGRTLARCSVGGVDLNRTMVARGYALAYRRYSIDYVSAEESAKVGRRGIWTSTFELPSLARHGDDDHVVVRPDRTAQPSGSLPVISNTRGKPQPNGSCRIKGNHSRKGERIYHLPGMPYYAQTVAEEIFCTEAEARAAGYRRSRADRQR